MTNSMEVDSVQLNFGGRVILSSVYLSCQTGKISSLLGRNGTGKSCLFNIVVGHLKVDNVSVKINDTSYFYAKEKNKMVTFLPQYNFIPRKLTFQKVFDFFDIPISTILQYFPEFKNSITQKMGAFSTGDRRLIEVLSVVFSNSLFSILDEPFSQLSPVQIEKLSAILIKEKNRKGLIITDHLYKQVLDISDEVFGLSDGIVRKINSKEDLKKICYLNKL